MAAEAEYENLVAGILKRAPQSRSSQARSAAVPAPKPSEAAPAPVERSSTSRAAQKPAAPQKAPERPRAAKRAAPVKPGSALFTSALLDTETARMLDDELLRRLTDGAAPSRVKKSPIIAEALELGLKRLASGKDIDTELRGEPCPQGFRLDLDLYVRARQEINGSRLAGGKAKGVSVSSLVRDGLRSMAAGAE